MKYKLVGIIFGGAIVLSSVLSSTSESFAQRALTCDTVNGSSPRMVRCPIPLGDVGDIQTVTVTDAVSKANIEGASATVLPSSNQEASWLFLVDVSNPRRVAAVQSAQEFIINVLDNAEVGDRYGVASFAEEIQINAVLGSKLSDLRSAAQGLKATGLTTGLYRAASEGVRKLAAEDGNRRKALVIISDGEAEDQAFTKEEVIEQAKAAGVVIYGIGIPERATEARFLQNLERLALETDGPYFTTGATNKAISENFVSDFKAGLLGGGKNIVIPVTDTNASFNIAVTDAAGNTTDFIGTQSGNSVSGSAQNNTDTVQPNGIPREQSISDLFFSYWNDSVYRWVIIGLGALLAFLLFAFSKKSRSRVVEDNTDTGFHDVNTGANSRFVAGDDNETTTSDGIEFESDDTKTVAVEQKSKNTRVVDPKTLPIAKFEIEEDGNSYEFNITESSIRIGRNRDNDLRLGHDTVHRNHALLHSTPQKVFILTDLATKNGVLLNGKLIDKQELVDGDVVELGEVTLTFRTIL